MPWIYVFMIATYITLSKTPKARKGKDKNVSERILFRNGVTPDFDIFWDYYIKPYVRIVPYMIGVLGGWVYYKKEQFIRGFDKGSIVS